ncbi:MAG: peptide deformylase [Bacteroidales bacterium]|nr:peptide deformylase [Bacteroidales bacterium]
MILPITLYGNPVLRKTVEEVDFASADTDLKNFVNDLFDTMYQASGVGLAAPQVNRPIAVFVIDTEAFLDEGDTEQPVKKAFINPEITATVGGNVRFSEGCLSVPGINEEVLRPEGVRIRYQDVEGNQLEEEYHGKAARVIQHEYDHLFGKVFVDRLSPLKKTLLKSKLNEIVAGKKVPAYRIKPNKK